MALAEALTNIAGIKHKSLAHIALSANWMSSTKSSDERGDLLRGVQAVTNFADYLNVAIPVGKDSLSMKTMWNDGHGHHSTLFSLIRSPCQRESLH